MTEDPEEPTTPARPPNPADQPYRKPFVSDLDVRKAAARVAVAASKKTGRPVSPEVQALADLP